MACDRPTCLMCTNVGDARLRKNGCILLAGTCVRTRFPEIIEQQKKADSECTILEVCLEETHMNMAGYKLASIVKYSGIGRVTVLTVDGSPHCTQLHHLVEDIKNHFATEIETVHYVIEKGKVHRVSSEAVKRARHLSKIESSTGKN